MDHTDPPVRGGELELLTSFLDFQRATVLQKVLGLDRLQLAQRLPCSSLTLAGLLFHLALVEEAWLVETFQDLPMPAPFGDVDWDADPDWEFRTAVEHEPSALIARYEEACARSRAAVAAAPDGLETLSAQPSRRGEGHFNLRWILLHLIEETARHAGHADLLREAIDGRTGE